MTSSSFGPFGQAKEALVVSEPSLGIMGRDVRRGPHASMGDMRRSGRIRSSILHRSRAVLRETLHLRSSSNNDANPGPRSSGRRTSVCGAERPFQSTEPPTTGNSKSFRWGREVKSMRMFATKDHQSSRTFGARRSARLGRKRKSEPKPRHHRRSGGFVNPWESGESSRESWRFTSMPSAGFLRKSAKPKELEGEALAGLLLLARRPQIRQAKRVVTDDKRAMVLHWIGHATLLLQIRGLTVLTDPVWSSSLGPLGPKRLVPPVCDIDELPSVIDVVLISSSSYDHYDKLTICRLASRVTRWLVPLGMKSLLVDAGVFEDQIQQLDWWQEVRIGQARFTCTPSQHTGGKDNTLWCSWVLSSPYHRLFYCGGTGYRAVLKSSEDSKSYDERLERGGPVCPVFKEIGKRYGPFDTALLPIGGYRPRSSSSATQGDPLDMIFIHQDLQAKRSIGHRWGTYALPDEGILDPVRYLERAILGSPVSEHDFTYLHHGWLHNT